MLTVTLRYIKYLLQYLLVLVYHCTVYLILSSPSNLVDQALFFPCIAARISAIDYYLRRS